MDDFPIISINPLEAFPALAEIPQVPRLFSMRGTMENVIGKKLVCFVGSRKCTAYGKSVCQSLIESLQGYPIVIVSGLALGIDSIAHQAALDNGITTIAFPGSGLGWDALYPAQHRGLAENILMSGGALISEYKEHQVGAPWTFPQRNRLMAGISDLTIIVEAEEKSGTLITARLATDYNKSVGAIPGPITSPSSKGANWLLKLGATPITGVDDILEELGLAPRTTADVSAYFNLTPDEERVLSILNEAKTKEMIITELNLDPVTASIVFSSLEIKGVITEMMGIIERVA